MYITKTPLAASDCLLDPATLFLGNVCCQAATATMTYAIRSVTTILPTTQGRTTRCGPFSVRVVPCKSVRTILLHRAPLCSSFRSNRASVAAVHSNSYAFYAPNITGTEALCDSSLYCFQCLPRCSRCSCILSSAVSQQAAATWQAKHDTRAWKCSATRARVSMRMTAQISAALTQLYSSSGMLLQMPTLAM